MCRVHLCLVSLALAGCPTAVDVGSASGQAPRPAVEPVGGSTPDSPPSPGGSDAVPSPSAPATADPPTPPAPPPVADPTPEDGQPLATVSDDVALPLRKLLGKPPAEVEALLAEPLGKGRTRESCLRFTPTKQWFQCSWVWQRYGDKTGNFKAVQVTFEDGISAELSFEGLPGKGAFSVDEALRTVGLTLPGSPRNLRPELDAEVWEWFNDQARLVIDGNQYRVMLSVRDNAWEHSKLDVMLNSPLTEAQRAKLKPVD
jgi:hypothetical protein